MREHRKHRANAVRRQSPSRRYRGSHLFVFLITHPLVLNGGLSVMEAGGARVPGRRRSVIPSPELALNPVECRWISSLPPSPTPPPALTRCETFHRVWDFSKWEIESSAVLAPFSSELGSVRAKLRAGCDP